VVSKITRYSYTTYSSKKIITSYKFFSRALQKAYKTICNILKYKVSYQNYLVHTTVQTNATWQLPQTTHPINSYSLTFHAHFLLQSQLRQLQFLAHIFILQWTDSPTHQNQILDHPGHSLITILTELSQLPHYQGTKCKYLIHSHQKYFLKVSHFEKALKVYEMLQWWCQITKTLHELRSCGEAMLLNHNRQNDDCLLIAQKISTVSCRSWVKLGPLVSWSQITVCEYKTHVWS